MKLRYSLIITALVSIGLLSACDRNRPADSTANRRIEKKRATSEMGILQKLPSINLARVEQLNANNAKNQGGILIIDSDAKRDEKYVQVKYLQKAKQVEAKQEKKSEQLSAVDTEKSEDKKNTEFKSISIGVDIVDTGVVNSEQNIEKQTDDKATVESISAEVSQLNAAAAMLNVNNVNIDKLSLDININGLGTIEDANIVLVDTKQLVLNKLSETEITNFDITVDENNAITVKVTVTDLEKKSVTTERVIVSEVVSSLDSKKKYQVLKAAAIQEFAVAVATKSMDDAQIEELAVAIGLAKDKKQAQEKIIVANNNTRAANVDIMKNEALPSAKGTVEVSLENLNEISDIATAEIK